MSLRVLIDHTECEKRRDFNEVMAIKQTVSVNSFLKGYLDYKNNIPSYLQVTKNSFTGLSTVTLVITQVMNEKLFIKCLN